MSDLEGDSSEAAARRFKRRVAYGLLASACLIALCGGGWVGVKNARYAAQVSSAKCSMSQIGLAAHNFQDTYGHLPPLSADGRDDSTVTVPASFHRALLPFMELDSLYRSTDKTVPWDDPKNKKAFSTALPGCRSDLLGPETGPTGYALAHFVPNSRLIEQGRGIEFSKITDGLSNTVLDGSIGASFPAWGDPGNGRDPALGFAGGPAAFGGLKDGALIGLADGSVRFISSAATDPEVALSLATPAGGEVRDEWAPAELAEAAAEGDQMEEDDSDLSK